MVDFRELLLAGVLASSSVGAGCALPLRVSQYDYDKPIRHKLQDLHEVVQSYESSKQDEVGIRLRNNNRQYEISFTQREETVSFDLGVCVGKHWTRFYGTIEEGVIHGFTAFAQGHGQFRRTFFTAEDVENDKKLMMTYTLATTLLSRTAQTGGAEPLYPQNNINFSILGKKLW